MDKIILSLAAIAFAAGCSGSAAAPVYFSDHASSAKAKAPIAKDDPLADDDAYHQADEGARKVGDFVVYKFSGSFRKTPITISEKVIAKKGDVILIDVTATEGSATDELFVKMSDAPARRNEVISVSKKVNGKLVAANADAFDAMMAKATLTADRNDGATGTEDVTVEVGAQKVAAKKTAFTVKVGKKSATMHTIATDGFAWGDLGGDITTANGKTLYKAEVLDAGHSDASKTPELAGELDEF